VLLSVVLLAGAGALPGAALQASETQPPLPVMVSIPPQVFFVQRVGGDRVAAKALVLPGESPATYSPTPAQVAELVGSAVYFRIGVPFEERLMAMIQQMRTDLPIVDLRESVRLRRMHGTHSHEQENDHEASPEGYDPHTWMDPSRVRQQAAAICRTLCELDPAARAHYEHNLRRFEAELDTLDRRIKTLLEPVKGARLYVFHPSFGYFAEAYGLTQVAVEMEGKAPKGKALAQMIRRARQDGVRVVFVQPQFDRRAAANIARAINGAVVVLDPLAADYLNNLEQTAQRIAAGLKGGN